MIPSPIVFTGLSIRPEEACNLLAADYRPPIRRGDLEAVPDGVTVVIIDGVFDQQLAVSPTEVRSALARGVRIFGAASMGALRAVEVPGVVGIGRIFEMYAEGAIEDDDEVAIVFHPETLRPLSEPLVNIRHASNRLASSGTISRSVADRIVSAAKSLPYYARTYPEVLAGAGFGAAPDADQLARMLGAIDLKHDDAISVLEHVRRAQEDPGRAAPSLAKPETLAPAQPPPVSQGHGLAVHLWEFGGPVDFRDVVDFLAFTGALASYAERAQGRRCGGVGFTAVDLAPDAVAGAQARALAKVGRAWQWTTEEEVATSLADLGVDSEALTTALASAAQTLCAAQALTREGAREWMEALRVELFLDDLALKRETARLMSLRTLADEGRRQGPPRPEESAWAADQLCRRLDTGDLPAAIALLERWGVSPQRSHRFLDELALASRSKGGKTSDQGGCSNPHPWLGDVPKAADSRRFCASLEEAYEITTSLRETLGITRVSMITGLGDIGIPNAQAFRPNGEWSSTVGSGKSESAIGAKVGAVLEEAEKWSQERFSARHTEMVARRSSYLRLLDAGDERAVDPARLDLPYDSCYRPDLEIDWYRAEDLASGRQVLVPAAAFNHRRLDDDIYFSRRGARKTVTTNGLAAGVTLAEALTHALCEFIERHARTLDFVAHENPGAPASRPRPFIDLATLPPAIRRLAETIRAPGHRLFLHDIRADIQVPTIMATIVMRDGLVAGKLHGDDLTRASGWAAHPDPETAVQMALLEASQTVISHIAGAREDLTLHARSLGRHERSDCRRDAAFQNEFDASGEALSFSTISGFTSPDAGADVRWLVERLNEAGCDEILAMDYSTAAIVPVRVVRVVVPGLETINAFHTGRRARRALLADLLPTPRAADASRSVP